MDKTQIDLDMERENIEILSQIKYLGLFIDEKLDMNAHVDYVCSKASKKLGVLNRLRKKMDIPEKICIYKTIVAPHFNYCASMLFLCNESQIYRMQKIQNRAMRAITNVNGYTSVNLMIDTLCWLSVRQRITLLTLELVHKICNGNAPEYLRKYVSKRGDTHIKK